MVITPQWSSDGKWIAFLKRVGGTTQVWKAMADGSGSFALTHSPHDVEQFRLLHDDRTLAFSTRPALANAQASIEHEGRFGFHYDDRYISTISSRPIPDAGIPFETHSLDLIDGVVHKATASESAEFQVASDMVPREASDAPTVSGKPQAWISYAAGQAIPPTTRPNFRDRDGHIESCVSLSCRDAVGPIWLTSDRRRVRFLKRIGRAQATTAIYEWRPGKPEPKRIYQTDDYLVDCQPIGDNLICARERATLPRHLTRVDIDRAKATVLFDPNPEFASLALGTVERLFLRNDFGIVSYADLVYPVGYRPGRSYPVVVVQYVSRGFLRGGTGDEYPIQALANRGYAVLSVNRPRHIGLQGSAKSYTDVDFLNLKDFADRRSVLSSIEGAVQLLIERGVADRNRIGITGLSDGSSTVQFAELNSSMFAAGIVSGCCWERTQGALLGPENDRLLTAIGWPNLIQPSPDFWSHISLAQNAKQAGFPLLFQMADDEYLAALESFTALKLAGVPTDMFVFPDEHHIKWQPAHRLAAYQRTIDWFDFWLKDLRPSDSRRREDVARWVALRKR